MPKLQITWIKSDIGYNKDQKQTLRALGFRKLNQSVEKEDNPSVRGMLYKVNHLIKYEVVK